MRVLVVGSGGREHALCWMLAASPLVTTLWCAPGNPGTSLTATNVAIPPDDVPALVDFAQRNAVDLVVPGPEKPLVAGLADALGLASIACCGPSAAAARLEGSKSFAKEVCDAAGVPTARWECFSDTELALAFVRRRGAPLVVKADGLAAGKGVVVAASTAEAEAAILAFMREGAVGASGHTVVVEEFLTGHEASFFALCDGQRAIPLGVARDHKRVGEDDTGPNTGGMGAISPPQGWQPEDDDLIMRSVVQPVLTEMERLGTPFRGILFVGLMMTAHGPKVIEFNVRLGDPEAQCLLPRLRSDLLPALRAACNGGLAEVGLSWRPVTTAAVVLAAKGYPGPVVVSHSPIGGLTEAAKVPGTYIFHASTACSDGRIVSAGGRVLTVVGSGPDVDEARKAAYAAVRLIEWPDGFYRRDIGAVAWSASGEPR